MRYRFSLGRGEAAMVLGGAALVGILLFCAGLMTGLAVAPDRSAPFADGAMASSPEPEPEDDPAAKDDAASADDEVAESDGEEPEGEGADGVGGAGPEDGTSVLPAAEGWSVPEGYGAPRGSDTRWASLPPADGADAGADADQPVEIERPLPAPPRGRSAAREPAAEPEPSLTPRPGGTRFGAYDGGGAPYALEVGRFRGEEAALKVMDTLRARGHDVYIYTVVEGGSPVFSVRMDRYVDRQAAMRAAERLETRERLAAVVVPTEQR